MLGLIHVILKDLIITKFGQDKWTSILRELDVQDEAVILDAHKQYDDATTVAGVEATCKVLGISWDDALEAYGAHFVAYVYLGGYGRMLKSMGDNLQDFLRNVNHMHQYLERHFRESSFPVWGVDPEGDGSFLLSYTSSRGLALKGIIRGLLSEAGRRLFEQKVVVEELEETRPGFLLTMRVHTEMLPEADRAAPLASVDPEHRKLASLWHQCLASLGRSAAAMDQVMPFASTCMPNSCAGASRTEIDEEEDTPRASEEDDLYLDSLADKVQRNPVNAADVLMRAVPAGRVCAEWKDEASLANARVFWETYGCDTRYFSYSEAASRASRFVSHSWRPPQNWAEVMGQSASYAEVKATELTIVARDLVARGMEQSPRSSHAPESWKEVLFWVDKCCIPQGHALVKEYFARIEDFIQRSDGMVVLLSWQYFQRLWCIYEWASFLAHHAATEVQLCVDAFLKPSTRQLYLRSIAQFSVSGARCDVEADRAVLRAKIHQHFYSEAAFESFVKCTAVALLAQTAVRRAGRNVSEYHSEVAPWVELAEEIGMSDLAAALRTAKPSAWRAEAMRLGDRACLGRDSRPWLERYNGLIDGWFEQHVAPIILLEKHECVRREFLSGTELAGMKEAKAVARSNVASSIINTSERPKHQAVAQSSTMSFVVCTEQEPGHVVKNAPPALQELEQEQESKDFAPASVQETPSTADDIANTLEPPDQAPMPQCPGCTHPMTWSNCASGVYQLGWSCEHSDACGAFFSSHGAWRWLCVQCSRDLCQSCAFSGPPPPAQVVGGGRSGLATLLGCGRPRGAVAQPSGAKVGLPLGK